MKPDVVALTQELVAADTVAQGEGTLAERCASILAGAGMQTGLVAYEPGREQLVAHAGAFTPLTLTGHLDVVPVNPADWDTDPFQGVVAGDRIIGRGVSDMKSGVAAIVVAVAEHVADRHQCRGVQVVLTSGEETGCTGAATLARDALRCGGPLLVAEPTQNLPVLAHKGALWLRLSAHGVAAHGSAPELGDNAVVRLARAAAQLHDYDRWPIQAGFGPVTANVGVFRGGAQTNVVPDAAEFELDIRYVPTSDVSALRETVADLAGKQVRVEDPVVLPPLDTPADDPFVALVREALRAHDLVDTAAAPARYFTDASVLSSLLSESDRPVPTVVLGPGEPDQCHVANEWCSVPRLREAVEVYRSILSRWCEAAG